MSSSFSCHDIFNLWLFGFVIFSKNRYSTLLSNAHKMGIGGSTAARSPNNSASTIPRYHSRQASAIPPLQKGQEFVAPTAVSSTICLRHTSQDDHPPSGRCCSHFKINHAHLPTAITPKPRTRQNSVDQEIEEIVANTLDLPNGESTAMSQLRRIPHLHDSNHKDTSQNGSARTPPHLYKNGRTSVDLDLDIDDVLSGVDGGNDVSGSNRGRIEIKESLQDIDFAKFKRVNEKGSAVLRNGKMIHQESDLLWRLGLISPEAYPIKNPTRSAPSATTSYLKPPSYDITEEQLMNNIEKEFAEYAGTVN